MGTATWTSRVAGGFAAGAAVGLLGGLIGLGGAEFRLPLLVGRFGFDVRSAIRLNLLMSLITVLSALAIRIVSGATLAQTTDLLDVVVGLALGAMVGAFVGASMLSRISERRLRQAVQLLLAAIGGLLVLETFIALEPRGLAGGPSVRVLVATVVGLPIGVVSSLLGVAGGELIIPTLMFIFGAGIKVAGTASLMVSLPALLVGVGRSVTRAGAPAASDLTGLVIPMGIGSILGAVFGGALAASAPIALLKLALGLVLIWSAARVFHRS